MGQKHGIILLHMYSILLNWDCWKFIYLWRKIHSWHGGWGFVTGEEELDLIDESLMVVRVLVHGDGLVLHLLQFSQLHHVVQVRACLKPLVMAVPEGG